MNRTLKEAAVRRYHYEPTGSSESTSAPYSGRLQLRQAPQHPLRPHTLRGRLQSLAGK